jgi:membrane protein
VLIIAIGVAGLIFQSGVVEQQVINQIGRLVGDRGVEAVKAMIANASIGNRSLTATIIGVGVLILGAIGAVVQLKDALNIIWDVDEPQASGIWSYIRKYVISLGAVLSLGFLLAVSLFTTTVISTAGTVWGASIPPSILAAINFAADLTVLTLLFAMMFKWLPDTKIAWSDVWVGAALTTLLFVAGK